MKMAGVVHTKTLFAAKKPFFAPPKQQIHVLKFLVHKPMIFILLPSSPYACSLISKPGIAPKLFKPRHVEPFRSHRGWLS